MEKIKDEIQDKGKDHSLKLEDVVNILDALVDEAEELVKMELVPYIYKYRELDLNPQPELQFRKENFRFLLPREKTICIKSSVF